LGGVGLGGIPEAEVELMVAFFFWEDLVFISASYLFTNSRACTWLAGSHESWAGAYPFHLTLYCRVHFLPTLLDPTICLTSNSGSPLMMSGGGSG
jgi:hypothetical protein